MRRVTLTAVIAAMVIVAGCSGAGGDAAIGGGDGANMAAEGGSESIGVSAGGAQDANAFRTNVREGYVPQPSDLTYEGLFHDYYFDTGQEQACERTFCPTYSKAVTRDPLSNETERFVTVGLNSGITKEDFQRQPLNLVVVVDVSGSMDSPFDEYYYDGGEKKQVEENRPKMDAAGEAVVSMLDRLNGSDRVSVVTYEDNARTVQELQRVDETDMSDLRSDVRNLKAGGGTNLDAGVREAYDQVEGVDTDERETRVVYVTDAQPNLGETDGDSLEDRLRSQAGEGIHTTFVGVGVDFNSRLTESISTVKGANYYSVHSPSSFEQRMDEGFQYMVTPLVYNLTLDVHSEGYEIEKVYGSPQADRASGELMEVRTLFPSRSEGNKSEGGVVLLELAETGADDPTLNLTASYELPSGETREVTRDVAFEDREPPYYESSGVRKAVVLSEYANLLRNWMAYERGAAAGENPEAPAASESIEAGKFDSQWEQTSVDLTVSGPYADRIAAFQTYFGNETAAFDSDRFERDRRVLQTLVERANGESTTEPDATGDAEATTVHDGTPSDSGTGDSENSAAGAGFLPVDASALGLVNLVVTLFVAGYGIRQKRRSRGADDDGRY